MPEVSNLFKGIDANGTEVYATVFPQFKEIKVTMRDQGFDSDEITMTKEQAVAFAMQIFNLANQIEE